MNLDIANSIVEWVNKETGLKLRFAEITSGGSIVCRNEKHKRIAIVCYGGAYDPIVRSVIKEKRSGCHGGFNWLCNGQAGKNAIELAYWDEYHRYKPTLKQVADYLKERYIPGCTFDFIRFPLAGFTKEEIMIEINK
jgi:hypothetical protein